jgi:hypothetical protein
MRDRCYQGGLSSRPILSEPNATPAKSCGPCTACCKVMAVDALAKPAGTACVHVRAGRGCGVYPERPRACRTFECVWLMDEAMPHRFRPDQTRVVLDQDAEGRWLVARCDPANPHAWRRNPMYAALKARARETWGTGRIVLATAGRQAWLIAPREDVDLGEIDLSAGLRVTEHPDGSLAVEAGGG